jgi:hypothetical protein
VILRLSLESPIAIEGGRNVWCCSASLGKKFAARLHVFFHQNLDGSILSWDYDFWSWTPDFPITIGSSNSDPSALAQYVHLFQPSSNVVPSRNRLGYQTFLLIRNFG